MKVGHPIAYEMSIASEKGKPRQAVKGGRRVMISCGGDVTVICTGSTEKQWGGGVPGTLFLSQM